MDLLQKEHDRVWKRSKTPKNIEEVQKAIDLLQNARDTIANDPNAAQITLARLQNPVKSQFDAINSNLKEVHGGLTKYSKALEKLFKDKPIPSTEIDAMSSHPALVNRAIAMHLLREGQFSVASTFLEEIAQRPTAAEPPLPLPESAAAMDHTEEPEFNSEEMKGQFSTMYDILQELKENKNLQPAIDWARHNKKALENRGSNLEFELCRLQFVHLFKGGDEYQWDPLQGQQRALEYARKEFQGFAGRYMNEIQQLMGAMPFYSNLGDSPYAGIFLNFSAWDEVATSFTREFCSLLGLSADSPLYIAATAGAIALPTLLKLQTIMKEKRTEWTTQNELPVEIPLPPAYQFHSIFVCPVSKEQTTDQNPPMMMPCGHVIAQQSLMRISRGGKFKCPYCPNESTPKEARKVFL